LLHISALRLALAPAGRGINRTDKPMRLEFDPHVAFCVTDRAAATKLYCDVLGMELVDEYPTETMLALDQAYFYVQSCDHDRAADHAGFISHTWLAFTTDDVPEMRQALEKAGCRVEPYEASEGLGYLVQDGFGLQFFLSS